MLICVASYRMLIFYLRTSRRFALTNLSNAPFFFFNTHASEITLMYSVKTPTTICKRPQSCVKDNNKRNKRECNNNNNPP